MAQLQSVFLVARSTSNRPTLMHSVDSFKTPVTKCGWEIRTMTRGYLYQPILGILCKKCAQIDGIDLG